ncbi:MAG TPA: hypothetical protein VGZ31_05355 [Chthoniobacterales bacterium]|jgi:hypothetical protein|nr:hypothetical protein [Chthoniobacterales bacterium]
MMPLTTTGKRSKWQDDLRAQFMTICIAAICRKENMIITATDFMLSSETISSESPAAKISLTGHKNRWVVMFSGDPSINLEVKTEARRKLVGKEEYAKDLISAFQGAFKDRICRKIEDEILSPFGITREQFLKEGRANFGDDEFLRILREIETTGLETDFLVAGFEPTGRPCLLSFFDPGSYYIHDMSSFHAIGNGATLADSSLTTKFNPFGTLSDCIYRVSEAKFLGQKAPGVGKQTFVSVLGSDGKWNGIGPRNMDKIQKLWEEKGQPPVPDEAVGLIKKSFDWNAPASPTTSESST